MAMNKKLLKQIAERIVEVPKEFNMNSWFGQDNNLDDGKTLEQCGTTGCIAGEACFLTGRTLISKAGMLLPKRAMEDRLYGGEDWEKQGRLALGITERQAKRLFYVENWPDQFNYNGASSREAKACVAANRIKFFIETNGTDNGFEPTDGFGM